MKVKISKAELCEVALGAYNRAKEIDGGQNASYIPYLNDVPKDLFGLSLTLPSGEIISYGDSDYLFGIESISKVFTALLVLEQYGADEVLSKIGADATGLPFNSIMAILLESDHPSTPLVNAGAIAAVSMVTPMGNIPAKWTAIMDMASDLCADRLSVIEDLYRSEAQTNHNNHAIAWLLKSYDRLYDDPTLSLDLYTRQCSVGVSARQLSVAAATIACRGENPVTGKRVFSPELAVKIISLMASVGFYEHSGDWIYESGIPAKSGVGGGVMGVIPGGFGIAAFSPGLDEAGNSVRAQAVIKMVTSSLGVNIYGGDYFEIVE